MTYKITQPFPWIWWFHRTPVAHIFVIRAQINHTVPVLQKWKYWYIYKHLGLKKFHVLLWNPTQKHLCIEKVPCSDLKSNSNIHEEEKMTSNWTTQTISVRSKLILRKQAQLTRGKVPGEKEQIRKPYAGGPCLVQFLGPGKNHTMRNSY
jgi:hypothetical protein